MRARSVVRATDDLDVVVVDPPDLDVVERETGELIKLGAAIVEVAGKIFGDGGGGGRKYKCESKIEQTTDAETGATTTTVTTVRTPA
jgi:hypothetical protein